MGVFTPRNTPYGAGHDSFFDAPPPSAEPVAAPDPEPADASLYEDADEEQEQDAADEPALDEGADEQEEVADAAPEIDPDLRAFGAHLGYTDEQMLAMDAAGVLGHTLHKLAESTPSQKATAEEPDTETDEVDDLLDDEVFDERLVRHLKKQQKQLEEMRATVERAEARERQQAERALAERFDAALERMGPDYTEVFGSGPGSAQKPDSTEMANRMRVWSAINTLHAGLQANGDPIPDFGELVERAVRMEFGAVPAKRLARDVAKRQSQLTVPPNRQQTAPQHEDPEQAAIAAVRAKMRDMGLL